MPWDTITYIIYIHCIYIILYINIITKYLHQKTVDNFIDYKTKVLNKL